MMIRDIIPDSKANLWSKIKLTWENTKVKTINHITDAVNRIPTATIPNNIQ